MADRKTTLDLKRIRLHQARLSSPRTEMSMMRIAVAGTGGLARLIAYYIEEETSHHVMLLSRTAQARLSTKFQVSVIDYNDEESVQFALRGIDTVISTVTGPNQIALIKAAVASRVRRFAPAEFEGLPALRPNGPLNRHQIQAQQWLASFAGRIETTNFVCGIFYERFQPGGLRQNQLGLTSGYSGEGDYMMDCRNMCAQVPAYNANNELNVTICMTSVQDVARFVTKAIDLPVWPSELRMCGERVSVHNLAIVVERLKEQDFSPREIHSPMTLRSALAVVAVHGDQARAMRLHTLIATAEGRYDFSNPNLNAMFPEIQPHRFANWFRTSWDL